MAETIPYKHSDEIRAKISKSVTGLTKTPEHRAKLSESVIGRVKTKKHKKNISAAMKKSWALRKQTATVD